MVRTRKRLGWIRRFVRWLFGAPFQELPQEFGELVPPELAVFEAEAEEAQHRVVDEVPQIAPIHHEQTKPIRPDESLERE